MPATKINKTYSYTQSELTLKAKTLIGFMRRDEADFLQFGISTDMVNAFENDCRTFDDLATDDEFLASQMDQTKSKNEAREAVVNAIKNCMTSISLKYASHTARYKQFGVGAISRSKDTDLLLIAKKVIRIATPMLPDFATFGLTKAKLADLKALADAFEEALIEQHLKIGERDIAQEDRIIFANELHSTLSKYAVTGQSIWETRSVAKHNDYILHGSKGVKEANQIPDNADL